MFSLAFHRISEGLNGPNTIVLQTTCEWFNMFKTVRKYLESKYFENKYDNINLPMHGL